MVVLFASLKGSTKPPAGHDPEQARSIVGPVFELMIDAVHDPTLVTDQTASRTSLAARSGEERPQCCP